MNINFELLFKKYRTVILWSISSLLLSGILILLVILPQLVVIRQNDQLIQSNQKKIASFKAKIKDLKSFDRKEYEEDLTTTLVALPPEKDLPAALDQVQILLAKNRLQLASIAFDSSPTLGNVSSAAQAYQIKIGVSGDPQSFKNFVEDIKTAPKIMKLSGLTITIGQGGASQENLVLTAYFQPPPSSLGTIDQNIDLLSGKDKDLINTLSTNAASIPIISSSQVSGQRGRPNPFE